MHKGTKIQVFGEIQSGSDPVSASYSIDNGPSTYNSEEGVDSAELLVSQTLYISPDLPFGDHDLNLTVLNTGKARQYKPWYFAVYNSTALLADHSSNQADNHSHLSIGGIVGSASGALVLILLITFGIVRYSRRRRMRWENLERNGSLVLRY